MYNRMLKEFFNLILCNCELILTSVMASFLKATMNTFEHHFPNSDTAVSFLKILISLQRDESQFRSFVKYTEDTAFT